MQGRPFLIFQLFVFRQGVYWRKVLRTNWPHGLMTPVCQLPVDWAPGNSMEQVSSLSEIDQLTQLTLFLSIVSSHFRYSSRSNGPSPEASIPAHSLTNTGKPPFTAVSNLLRSPSLWVEA